MRAALATAFLAACSGTATGHAPTSTSAAAPTTASTTTSSTTSTTVPLTRWTGPVEHLFFDTLVIHPEQAFLHDQLGQGFRNYFVTVGEFKAILTQLYANGWTLVDIHRAVAGTVEVPPGRRPLALSEDDVNYYRYEQGRGIGHRLVLDTDGTVKVEEVDGPVARVTDNDLVPLVDEFVAAHPLFSADGAKGVLALTGYEGLLGEPTQDAASPGWAAAVARAGALAQRLKATGWTLASHSYGHIDLTRETTAVARRDTERWLAEATPVIGRTDIYIYPFGASPSPRSPTVQMLQSEGFTILCNIDVVPRLIFVDGVAIMSRRHIDGIAFADQARNLAPFFDVATVEDRASRR